MIFNINVKYSFLENGISEKPLDNVYGEVNSDFD